VRAGVRRDGNFLEIVPNRMGSFNSNAVRSTGIDLGAGLDVVGKSLLR
jgi:hypothetical protein